jgi:4-diphosphocytidyl-2-C-methyl-D-erythritol kinase
MPNSTLILSAPAKVNLSLRVRAKTDDGYHVLESLVGFADIGDRLHLAASKAPSTVEVSGEFSGALTGMAPQDNLILRAIAALEQARGQALNTHVVLEKNLPVAAGLGGGSADAAAALRGVMQLYGVPRKAPELAEMALSLGADVPVCLASAPAWMTGIGERLTALPDFPAADIILVNPRVRMPTAEVFAALQAPQDGQSAQPIPDGWSDLAALCDFLLAQGNDLQNGAISLAPVIADCVSALHHAGAKFAAMSGSGASCFALCEAGQGAHVGAAYRAQRGQDWVQVGRLIGAGDTKIDEA